MSQTRLISLALYSAFLFRPFFLRPPRFIFLPAFLRPFLRWFRCAPRTPSYEDRPFFFFARPSTSYHRLFVELHGDESGYIFVADAVSDRPAFLSSPAAPGQLEHSSSDVIVFASRGGPFRSRRVSSEKLTGLRSVCSLSLLSPGREASGRFCVDDVSLESFVHRSPC